MKQPGDIKAENERSLNTLQRAITLAQGRFSLILVHCNYVHLREQLLQQLQNQSDTEIQKLSLPTSAKKLYETIATEVPPQPAALIVLGLESVKAIDDLLTSCNQLRDEFRKSFAFPLVLWVNNQVLQKLVKLAPDFYTWAGAPIQFIGPTDDLIQFLQQEADELFTKILDAGAERFVDNVALDLSLGTGKRWEIESALLELQSRGYSQPELEANQQFILGRDAYINNQMERSRQFYEQSLAFWQQQTQNSKTTPPPAPHSLQQACLLFHLGLWWRRYAVLHRAEYETACRQARDYYQQCVEILQQANRPDLKAKFINSLGEVLQQLGEWDKLKTVATDAAELHKRYPDAIRLANAYAMLAEVALAKSRWDEAKEYAETALGQIPPTLLGWAQQHYQSWYRLLLAQAQRHVKDVSAALQNLERAKADCKLEYNPKLYIQILAELRSLYFEQHRYLEAFNLKQEQSSIEQQYGFRAFIGAGRLQSQRQVIHPSLVSFRPLELSDGALGISQQGAIAQEIVASGREQDVNRLIERISRDDHKLIVIHGPSGVGKSSLLNAGLVPALYQITAFDGRNPLAVVVQVYTNWMRELGAVLNSSPPVEGGMNSSVYRGTEGNSRDIGTSIIEQLRNNVEHNLFTVLIFDQFEEFFFSCPNPVQRKEFWEFLHVCLDSYDIPYVKVILSLREDYLHYLLECDRLIDLQVTKNDILNKEIRYSFGNFSPADAKHVIQTLTERSFYLEPALIDELVRDLAGELGEVRPIELQVVGTQLQTENITTLEKYQELGPKEKLVERFLDAIVQDCGRENERAAALVLYLLTDENNTRPLKTRAELAAALAAEADKLDLVLEIFVKSGLVFLIPQLPADCYQLVHDYLVSFIRQQRGAELLAELEREKQQRLMAEARVNKLLRQQLRIAYGAGFGLLAFAAIAVVFAIKSTLSSTNFQLSALASSSEALFASGQQEEALIESIKAGQQLQGITWANGVEADTHIQVLTALRQAVYESKGRELKTLKGHSSWVNSVSFSPDGKTLASASGDGTVKLWDTGTGSPLKTLKGHSSWVNSVSFSPNGKTLASASGDGTVKLWDTVTGSSLKTLKGHSSRVNSVSFSHDGKTLASASGDQTVKLWDTGTGSPLKTLKGHSDWVNSVSFSPDGKTLASASGDGTVKLWDTGTGSPLKTLKGHSDWVNSVSFSPDGKTLASASGDGTVKLWDTGTGSPLKTLKGHSDWVNSVSFSPDGKTLASASGDGTVKLWDTGTGSPLKTLKGHSDWVNSVSFSPDGKTLASASGDGTVKLWDTGTGSPLKTLKGHSDWVNSVSFSPDGKTLASASGDGTVKLWDTGTGSPLKTLKGHSDWVYSVSFSPDGKTLASASGDGTVKLWDTGTGSPLKTLKGHSSSVYSVSFSPDGKTLASASGDGTVKLWDTGTGSPLKTLKGHSSSVYSVSFSPDGKTLASASGDGTVKLWDTGTGSPLKTLKGHSSSVYSVSFSPDGKTLASASGDGTVKLWDTGTGSPLKTLKGHSSEVSSVSFSPDGKTLASASGDQTVKLWDTETGSPLKTLTGHSSWVSSVSFSPDGKTLASASRDQTIILWNFNLTNLLMLGCDWLKYYLPNHPETLEELQICQVKPLLIAAASTLVEQGEKLATDGDVEGAVAKFKQAKTWNPQLKMNPETKAQAISFIQQSERFVQQGEFKKAVATYSKAQEMDPSLEILASAGNSLCWEGSLRGYAKDVIFACEKAVAQAPEIDYIRDSRGLARALTGNTKGAIEDFQVSVNSTIDAKLKSQRQAWINALRAGQNPFTTEELKRLREQ